MPGLLWKDLFACVGPLSYRQLLMRGGFILTKRTLAPQLYKVNSRAPRVLARIARMPNMIMLEMTQEAMQLGLLEPAVVSTVMLNCGHNID